MCESLVSRSRTGLGDGCGSGEIFLDLEVGDLDVNDRLVVGACEGDGEWVLSGG